MCRRQLHEVETILDVWDEREDLDELRTLLGLNSQGRGRRRKMRTAVRESRMAMMVAAGVDVDAVAEKFRVDRRTVERAVDEWGEYAERVLSRQRRRGFKLDVERLADKK
ncbi:MAG TPA: helix-turn-helix domain-containing protein [Gammaproteobacteria bacterium]